MYTLKLSLGIVAMVAAVVGAMLLLNSEPSSAAARARVAMSGSIHAMHAAADSGKAHSGCPMMSGDTTAMHHGDSGMAGHSCCMMGGKNGMMSMDHSKGSAHAGHAMNAEMSAKAYAFSAVVKKIDLENKRIVLQHENIGDYMEAMTMPFSVKDAALLKDLKVGDQRFFVLQVDGDRAQIIAVKTTRAEADNFVSANGAGSGTGAAAGHQHGAAGKGHGCGM